MEHFDVRQGTSSISMCATSADGVARSTFGIGASRVVAAAFAESTVSGALAKPSELLAVDMNPLAGDFPFVALHGLQPQTTELVH